MPAAPQAMNRPAGYRYGSWLTLHGSGVHLVGFSTSCWLSGPGNVTMGLWAVCRDSRCDRLHAQDVSGWHMASRVLSCLGVVFLTLWLVVGCQCKCIRTRQQRYKWTLRLEEYLAILSVSCVALLSVGVFTVASARDSGLGDSSLGWSLWLVVGGASASTLGGFIVAGTRNSAPAAPKPCTRAAIRPLNSPAVGAASAADARGQEGSRANVQDAGRRHDVTDIFTVMSYARSANAAATSAGSALGGRTYAPRGVDRGGWGRLPPPPYSASDGGAYVEGGRVSSGPAVLSEGVSPQVQEVSLSPPPSYEEAMNELPPPYEPSPDYPTSRQTDQQQ